MYPRPSCRQVYFHDGFYFTNEQVYHDPEGLLGSINSILVVFLGLQAGKILTEFSQCRGRCVRMVIWGLSLCLIGSILAGFSQHDGVIPINKNLWSLSFVLVLGGGAFLILTFLYLLIDEWNLWGGTPFFFVGMNSILLYLLHEILKGQIPFGWKVHGVHSHEKFIIQNVIAVSIWTMYAYFCYHSNFFLIL